MTYTCSLQGCLGSEAQDLLYILDYLLDRFMRFLIMHIAAERA